MNTQELCSKHGIAIILQEETKSPIIAFWIDKTVYIRKGISPDRHYDIIISMIEHLEKEFVNYPSKIC